MNERRQNIAIGLFAIGGIAVLAFLIMLFGDVLTVGRRTYIVPVHFPRGATGVREGTSVTLNGKRIGQTRSIDFVAADRPQEGIVVTLAIEGRYALPEGVRVEVQQSLMGFGRPALQIVVDPLAVGERRMPRDGIWPIHGRVVEMLDQVIKPEVQQTFEIAAKQIGVFAEALTPAARDLHDLLRLRTVEEVDTDSTGRMVANLYTLVQRFDQTVKSFNEVLASPRNQENVVASLENIRASSEDVRAAMTDFKAFAADARTFAADARVATGNFNATLGSLRETVDSSGRKFADVADAASAVLRNVDRTVTLMNQGQGTMGLMLNDNRLYESLVLTTQRLTTAVEEIRDLVALMKKGNVRMSIF